MSLPAMLHTLPARNTAAQITITAQTGLMGLGFHFVARATRTNPMLNASSSIKTPLKYKARSIV